MHNNMVASGKKAAAVGNGVQPARAELFADLRAMINNPDFSDVLFRCEDGVRICASRMLLMARSPMLKNILSVKENKETQISLPDITSSTFLAILEFLYTGDMVQYSPRSSIKAYDIIRASRYFQLPKIEEIVTEFLTVSTSEGEDDIAKAALKLSVALEFGTHAGASNAIPASLAQILFAADLEPVHLRGLSEKAFRYYLYKTQSKTNPGTPSFGEYLRFRQVILWCVTQIFPDEAAQVVAVSVPDRPRAMALLQTEPRISSSRPADGLNREAGYLKSLLAKRQESATLVDSLLGLVDIRRIHAQLLDAVVEPLKVVPAALMMEAYRFQALHKAPKPPQYTWEHGSSYCTAGNGSVIAKAKPEVGFARYPVPIFRNYGVYEWAIVIEELCVEFCEIGFHNVNGLQDGKPNFTGGVLSQQPTGWALSMDVEQGTRINQRGGQGGGWLPFNKDFGHKNARVNVRLDMDQRNCAFSVDDDEYVVAWMDLPPSSVYYPAVSLGVGTLGRAHIDLISGFDML